MWPFRPLKPFTPSPELLSLAEESRWELVSTLSCSGLRQVGGPMLYFSLWGAELKFCAVAKAALDYREREWLSEKLYNIYRNKVIQSR